jgi:hypothetical protein
MFQVRDIVIYAVIAGLLSGGALSTWSWGRSHSRNVVTGLASVVGFAIWNFTLNLTDAHGFDVDAPVIPLSWADVGSGVLCFACTCLVLGLVWDPDERAGNVVKAAAIAGGLAVLLDLFVL